MNVQGHNSLSKEFLKAAENASGFITDSKIGQDDKENTTSKAVAVVEPPSTDKSRTRSVNEGNFFVQKQLAQAEKNNEEKAKLLRKQEEMAVQRMHRDNKKAMSREDLLHLLQDSVDKSTKTKIDKFISKSLESTKKLIIKEEKSVKDFTNKSPLRDLYASIPEQTGQRKFYKKEINQCEYEQMHEKNKVMKEIEQEMEVMKLQMEA